MGKRAALKLGGAFLAILGLLVSYSNCSDINLKNSKSPSSTTSSYDPNLINIPFKETPSDFTDPSEGTDPQSWQNQVSNPCISNTYSLSGYANNNVILSRTMNNAQCPGARPPYEIIDGCRVYDRDEINKWSKQNKLLEWTKGDHYIVNNLPFVSLQPYETVSIKINANEFLHENKDGRFKMPTYSGSLLLYYDVYALVSITTKPCVFKKIINSPADCQWFTDRYSYVSKKSDPEFLKLIHDRPEYNYCVLDEADSYYVNFRFVKQEDIENPNASTKNVKWSGFYFGFKY